MVLPRGPGRGEVCPYFHLTDEQGPCSWQVAKLDPSPQGLAQGSVLLISCTVTQLPPGPGPQGQHRAVLASGRLLTTAPHHLLIWTHADGRLCKIVLVIEVCTF